VRVKGDKFFGIVAWINGPREFIDIEYPLGPQMGVKVNRVADHISWEKSSRKLLNHINRALLTFTSVVVLLQLPAEGKEIFVAIEDSLPQGRTVVFVDRWGRLREQKVTTYTYLLEDGNKTVLPYKLPHLRDDRPFRKKHPILTFIGTYLAGPLAGYAGPTVVRDFEAR